MKKYLFFLFIIVIVSFIYFFNFQNNNTKDNYGFENLNIEDKINSNQIKNEIEIKENNERFYIDTFDGLQCNFLWDNPTKVDIYSDRINFKQGRFSDIKCNKEYIQKGDYLYFPDNWIIDIDPQIIHNQASNFTGTFVNTTVVGNSIALNITQEFQYTGTSFSISGGSSNIANAIYWNGTRWFNLDIGLQNITEHYSNWTNTGVGHKLGPSTGLDSAGFTWNGSDWLVLRLDPNPDIVADYGQTWNNIRNFSVGSPVTFGHGGLAWNGSSYFISSVNNQKIFEYNSNFANIRNYTTNLAADYGMGLYFDGNYWYMMGQTSTVYKFLPNWTYTGINFPVSGGFGLFKFNNSWYITDGGTVVYQYTVGNDYYPTGTYNTSVIDAGSIVQWNNLSWTNNSFNGMNITQIYEFQRTSPSYYHIGNIGPQNNSLGQTFTIGTIGLNDSFSLRKIGLLVFKVGNPGNAFVALQSVNSTGPTGGILAYGSFNGDTLTTSIAGQWINVTMTPYNLDAGKSYSVVIYSGNVGTGGDIIEWKINDTSTSYSGGDLYYSTNNGSKWTDGTWDGVFDIYGEPYNLRFQVSSCNNSDCNGATFVGPDNKSTSYFTSSPAIFNTTLVPNNRYFQYKTYLATGNSSITPNLNGITLDYSSLGPAISITTPTNNTRENNALLNVNYTLSGNTPQACWYSNDTYSANITITCGSNITTVNWVDGQHNITIYVNDSSNNKAQDSRTFYIDTINPIISWGIPATDNSTIKGKTNFTFNINITDLNLYQVNFSIKNSSGFWIYSNLSDNLNASGITTFNIRDLFVIGLNKTGNYTTEVYASDMHTLFDWNPETNMDIIPNGLSFTFDKKDNINLTLLNTGTASVNKFVSYKKKDRYSFNISFSKATSFDIKIEADKIVKVNTGYKGHIIINDKYWFDTMPYDSIVKEQGNGYIILTLSPSSKDLYFDSLGGLNIVREYKYFFLDTDYPYFLENTTTPEIIGNNTLVNFSTKVYDNGTGILSVYFGKWDKTSSIWEWILVSGVGPIYEIITSITDKYFGASWNMTDVSGNQNVTNTTFPYIDIVKPNVTFNYQLPADIDTENIFNSRLQIHYNISDNIAINSSQVLMYYKTNTTGQNYYVFVNGSVLFFDYTNTLNLARTTSHVSNSSSDWNFSISNNGVYPAKYNYNEPDMEDTPHGTLVLTGNNDYLKIETLNVFNTKQYNIFEIMANATGAGNLRAYYCNSTYVSGNPTTSSNCINFRNFPATTTFNHTHTQYSSHQIMPFSINATSGMLGTVYVTNTSYFLLRGIAGTTWYVYNISNQSRANSMRITLNAGTTWTTSNSTFDSHLHQFNGNETFYYYVCANDTYGNQNCSGLRSDLLEQGGLIPNVPVVYSPIEKSYKGLIDINYTAALSPNGYAIVNYNITLLNSSFTFNYTIRENNSLNLTYLWNSSEVPNGEYIILVTAKDNFSQYSFGYSSNFTINQSLIDDYEYPIFSNLKENPSNSSTTYNPLFIYRFNSTITSTNGVAGISFNNINYTLENISSDVFNSSINNLGAGDFYYYFWAYGNGSNNNFNKTGLFEYTINKSVPSLSITSSKGFQINASTHTTITGVCPLGLSCDLYQDYVLVSNPYTTIFPAGNYLFQTNTTGNENYTEDFTISVNLFSFYNGTTTGGSSFNETYDTWLPNYTESNKYWNNQTPIAGSNITVSGRTISLDWNSILTYLNSLFRKLSDTINKANITDSDWITSSQANDTYIKQSDINLTIAQEGNSIGFNSTFNETYDTWLYNYTLFNKFWYNMTIISGFYNVSYDSWLGNYSEFNKFWYNQTGGIFNITYDSWAGNFTAYSKFWYNMTILNSSFYNKTYEDAISYLNSTKANIGNCPAGQVVVNITTDGLQCINITESSINNTYINNTFINNTIYQNITKNTFVVNVTSAQCKKIQPNKLEGPQVKTNCVDIK